MPELDLAALAALGVEDAVIAERGRLDGDPAISFLAELPALAARWQERLELHGARLLPGGVLSAALSCWAGDERVVLKLSPAGAPSARAEAAALAAWGGRGACRLRFASDDGQAILLDFVGAGAHAPAGDEAGDARRAASLLRVLHGVAAPAGSVPDATAELRWRFERAHRLLEGPSHVRGVLDHAAVSAAHEAALQLHESRSTTVLCHGDFLDKNILLDERDRWCAIDPRPCLGDPALDAAFWALAHRGGQGATERWRIVAGAAELSPERVWAWVRVFAISEAVLARDATRATAYHAVLRHGDPDCST